VVINNLLSDIAKKPRNLECTNFRTELEKSLSQLKQTLPVGHLPVGLPQSAGQVRYYMLQLNKEEMVGARETINIPYLDRIFGQRYTVNTGHPHNSYYLVHKQSLANMNHLLETLHNKDIPLVMHFDTAFKLGNYHLSALVYQHPQVAPKDLEESEEDAIIPLVHLLHEDESHATLESFFSWFRGLMMQNSPLFMNQTKILVMDREYKGQCLEQNTHRVCSQHKLLKELERYGFTLNLRKYKTSRTGTKNLQYYTRSIVNLMGCSNLEDYKAMRDSLFQSNRMWTSPEGKLMAEYYKEHLEDEVILRGGHWHLMDIGLADGLNYQAWETYHRNLKHLKTKDNSGQKADITALRLFSFESGIHNNVMAAYYGAGKISKESIVTYCFFADSCVTF